MKIKTQQRKKALGSFLFYAVLIGLSITCIYPLLWLAMNSLKTNSELFNNPWWFGESFRFSNYATAWTAGKIGKSFINSTLVAVSSVGITIIVSSMAAFGLTRLKWKLSNPTLSLILMGVMIPIHSTLIPLFTMFNDWGITNKYIALILPYVAFALPTSIFILSGFMSTFPREIEEAVVIDGCGMAGLFWKIIFPMSKTPIATITIYNFVNMWNELMFALIFLSDPVKTTLPVSLTRFRGQYSTNWTVQLAAVVIMVIPSLAAYMFLNDKIIESMTIGSVKG
ncbi:MAG: carbohydrate ABC transporter permease [Ruminiclostridium sp.]|nr:carbohydrate ABC transporter permease [Ruminiclostridium sp.]